MLSSSEFCSELASVYCLHQNGKSSISTHSEEIDPEEKEVAMNDIYDEDAIESDTIYRKAIESAHQKKKELDYALSMDTNHSNDGRNSLELIAQDLWRWIEEHGISAIEEKQKLMEEMASSRKRQRKLVREIEDCRQQIASTNRELAAALKYKRQYSLSCESLQSELELMAKQLSREQGTDRNEMRMRDSSRSLRELKRRNSRGILIESQSRLYEDEDHPLDEEYFVDTRALRKDFKEMRHRRDISMDIPNQDILVKAFYRSQPATTDDEARYEMTHDSRSLSEEEVEEEILSVREVEMMEDQRKEGKRMEEIQLRMDKQEEKLDAMIQLMQCMAKRKEESRISLGYRSLGVVLMSFVCFAGYSSYQAQRRK